MLLSSLLLALGGFVSAIPSKGQYQNHQVVRFNASNSQQLQVLKDLIANDDLHLDLWNHLKLGQVDVRIPPESQEIVASKTSQIPSSVWIPDLQQKIDRERIHSFISRTAIVDKSIPQIFQNYRSTDEYMTYLLSLPGTTEFTIGQTYEKRSIRGVRFGQGNQSIVFNGGVHAREWISPSTTVYIADFLLSEDPKAVKLRSLFTFYVIPVVNVDGYAYTMKSGGDRMWRKNREPNKGSRCIGTDINRNFGFHWGEQPGASRSPCQEDYMGTGKFSTKEARAMQDFMGSLKNVLAYMDFHSYSQLWLYPWGWTCNQKSPDDSDFIASSQVAVKAVAASRGTQFEVQQSCELYPTTGTTDENFYTDFLIKYAMTVELPDTGDNGFILPASEIVPVGKETLAGMLAFWDYAFAHPKILYSKA